MVNVWLFCLVVAAVNCINIDEKSCRPSYNDEFEIIRLQCKFAADGIYSFSSEQKNGRLASVTVITMDRLTKESVIFVRSKTLKRLSIQTGDVSLCGQVVLMDSRQIRVEVDSIICSTVKSISTAAPTTMTTDDGTVKTTTFMSSSRQEYLKTTEHEIDLTTAKSTEHELDSTTAKSTSTTRIQQSQQMESWWLTWLYPVLVTLGDVVRYIMLLIIFAAISYIFSFVQPANPQLAPQPVQRFVPPVAVQHVNPQPAPRPARPIPQPRHQPQQLRRSGRNRRAPNRFDFN